jgi:hypothetical protein
MIQRKQTLFLLGVALIAIALLFVPFQKVTATDTVHLLCLMPGCSPGVMNTYIYAPMALDLLVLLLSIICIFLYKNRPLQYKIANLLMLLNVFIIGLFFLVSYVKETAGGEISYSIGSSLPVIGILLAFLAANFIKKDEQLVRSADRIR